MSFLESVRLRRTFAVQRPVPALLAEFVYVIERHFIQQILITFLVRLNLNVHRVRFNYFGHIDIFSLV
jgi:hypothetical protein